MLFSLFYLYILASKNALKFGLMSGGDAKNTEVIIQGKYHLYFM